MSKQGYKQPEEHKKNIGKANKGKNYSPETNFKKGHGKISNGSKGKHWKLTEQQKKERQKYSIIKDELNVLYWHQKSSMDKIANHFNCSETVIFSRMREYNIPRRSISEALIGKIVSVETRKKRSFIAKKKTGVHSPNWKGGISKNKNYKKIQSRKHYQKYRKNPQYRLANNIRKAIWNALKTNKKGRHWETLVGYTLKELKNHLEGQFDEKMNWTNYGPYWWVDHIKARALFHYTVPEAPEFKECWALRNLQPLEKVANMEKGNKI